LILKNNQKIAAFGSSYMESRHDIKRNSELWKTNSPSCQSATYRRCKWLFFHSFELSPVTVELAVNNVGVSGCKPYKAWLAGVCLFFDQAFLLKRAASLSTFFWGVETWQIRVRKPVDKSVTKLWKDLAERRSCWPRAITRLHRQSCKMPCPAHPPPHGQAKNFPFRPQSLVWRGFARLHLPPETVEQTVDNMRAHGYRPRWLWPWQVWLISVQLAGVARIREGGHAAC
jgi:hypothetical protein